MIPGVWPVWAPGLDWQDLYRRPLNIATYYIWKLRAAWFQRREMFLFFSHYKFIGANDPRGVASLGPRGLIGRIYVGDRLTLLHTKYVISGPHGFREEDVFYFFPIKSLWEVMTPGVWPVWAPGAWLPGFM